MLNNGLFKMKNQEAVSTQTTEPQNETSSSFALVANRLARLARRPEAGALIGTVGVFIFFAITGGAGFLSEAGAASWLNVAAELGIIAIPVGLLMIAGELDLSVGSVLAASSMVVSIWTGHYHLPILPGILLALLVGVLTGIANGSIVNRTRLPSFIVTLATSLALAGMALGFSLLLTGTTSVSMQPEQLAKDVFAFQWRGQFYVSILWWIGISVIASWILNETRYGNWIMAVGGDHDTARAAGVRTASVKLSLFVASGVGAALVGVIQAIEFNGSQVNNGQAFVFNSIIAVVVGGVLLTGGYGSIIGVMLGTLTFSIVNQGIYYTGWNSEWAQVILGGLLLAAVLANNSFRKLALSSATSGKGSDKVKATK
jgi:simple sugar transport system permease protein